MRCMRCGWPSKNYETSNDGRAVHAPRRGLAEISAIPPLLAGLDESVFAAPPEVAPQPVPGICGPAFAAGTSRGPVSQGRWLVSLTQWTAANPRPCHRISLMQAEPRYSR